MNKIASVLRPAYKTTLSRWYLFLITPLIVLCGTVYLYLEANSTDISIGDALGFFSLGIRPITRFDPHNVFEVPLHWLLLYTYIFFATTIQFHPKSNSFQHATLFNLQKRSFYWISTYIGTLGSVLIHFILIAVTVFGLVLISEGSVSLSPTSQFFQMFIGPSYELPSSYIWLIYSYILPLLTCLSLSTLVICLTHYLGAPQAFILIISLLVVSAFFTTFFLPGNYLMILRCNLYSQPGVSIGHGLLINVCMLVIAFVLGLFKINRFDFI